MQGMPLSRVLCVGMVVFHSAFFALLSSQATSWDNGFIQKRGQCGQRLTFVISQVIVSI